MRVSPNFAKLVKLVSSVIADVKPFMMFFLIWMFVNAILYRVAKVEIIEDVDGEYPKLGNDIGLILQTFGTAIGNINPPTYEWWFPNDARRLLQEGPSGFSVTQILILIWAWVLLLFNVLFMFIILCNFLIAIISQTYDEVMGKEQIFNYESKCDLNIEAAIINDAMDSFFSMGEQVEPIQVFYLISSAMSGSGGDEFSGIVKSIQNSVRMYAKKVMDVQKKEFAKFSMVDIKFI